MLKNIMMMAVEVPVDLDLLKLINEERRLLSTCIYH